MNTLTPKADRTLLREPGRLAPEDPKQRRLMVGSLCLLLLALGIVLWHDRDFWFGSPQEAASDQTVESTPAAKIAPAKSATITAKPVASAKITAKPKHRLASLDKSASAQTPPTAPAAPEPAGPSIARTVLPPLDVEVVAGDTHRTIRPLSSSVRVDLQPDTPSQPAPDTKVAVDTENASHVTNNAAEHVQMSVDTSDVVAHPVNPSYPLLARQMKVQGSVILQALISKDGVIQNLRVVSGPHILASAAQDAVRQWHFKPHLEGSEAVETQAKITVNFTISTN
jgi:TonB family protein